MIVRSMRPDELDAAVGVWREANIVRRAPHGPLPIRFHSRPRYEPESSLRHVIAIADRQPRK
jgi:hypothetical protein